MLFTSDNQAELFDLVNDKDKVIGLATRKECHSNNKLTHRAALVITYNADKKFYIQKRSTTKDLYPGKWTFSASGHVVHGSNYLETIIREVKEELGLEIPAPEFKLLTKLKIESNEETEIVSVYLLFQNGPFTLNKSEIDEGIWVPLEKLCTYPGTPCFTHIINQPKIIAILKTI